MVSNYEVERGFFIPGLFSIGKQSAIIVKAPFIIPDPPIPATALPTINMFDEVATPHKREPSSNIAKNIIKTHLAKVSVIRRSQSIVTCLDMKSTVYFPSHRLERTTRQ
jgi:hypothetical protein